MDILLYIALIPPIVLMVMIYRMDKVEREPIGMILRLFIFGALTTIAASILEGIMFGLAQSVFDPTTLLYRFIENFICIALMEELVKYFALRVGSWRSPAFNYRFDGIVYSVAVTLGFATLENVGYVLSYGLETGIVRAVTAIPGHCIFGIYMGIFYSFAKAAHNRGLRGTQFRFSLTALLLPMLLHGTYDFLARVDNMFYFAIFIGFITVLDVLAIRTIRKFERYDESLDDPDAINMPE